MKNTNLAVGFYKPTDTFREIEEHTAIMNTDTLGLVALTGRAHDKESEEIAHLFSAAPELLTELENLLDLYQPQTRMGADTAARAREAIAKAKGL